MRDTVLSRIPPAPAWVLGALLAAWAIVLGLLNLPGHLSVDSLIQIAEGKSGVYESWNPLFISKVFGGLTAASGGTGILVVISTAALGMALWLFLAQRRLQWHVILATGALLFAPILLIYPAVVWKDVWFAHAVLLAFAMIHARERLPTLVVEVGVVFLLAFAAMSRQTGMLVAVFGLGALALARSAGPDGPRWTKALLGWAARLATMMALSAVLSYTVTATAVRISGAPVFTGVRLVALFDIAGILARAPDARLDRFKAYGVDTPPIEEAARRLFTPERIDTLDLPMTHEFANLKPAQLLAQWADLVMRHPGAYLRHRLDFSTWILGLRGQSRCVPAYLGYGPEELVRRAGLQAPPSAHVPQLYAYAMAFSGTPYFAPLTWALLSAITLWRLARRKALTSPMAMMQWGALAYLASYVAIGLACDFRYTYFSSVAGATGLLFMLGTRSARQA